VAQTIISHFPMGAVTDIVGTAVFVFFATIFMIYEIPNLKVRLEKGLGKDNNNLNEMIGLIDTFIKYFLIRVKVNLFAALGFIGIFLAFDINFALLWGILTFFLGFIPYLGIMIAAIPPILATWAKYGIQGAILITILFIIVNTIAESIIFPRQTGKGLQMSIYVVFVSLFVWGWILGPSGFLLAIPLTIIVIKYLEKYDETRWLAILMTSDDDENNVNE
jgi:AI-2 transport protein TqsA